MKATIILVLFERAERCDALYTGIVDGVMIEWAIYIISSKFYTTKDQKQRLRPVHCIKVQSHAAHMLKLCRDEGDAENRQSGELKAYSKLWVWCEQRRIK